MINSLIPCCWCIRRARARNCKIDNPAVSSISSLDDASRPDAVISLGKSASLMNPSRMLRMFTRASEHNMRKISDDALISRLNTPTGSPISSATCSAMFIARDVLPTKGRAATMIISPPCRPSVILSRSVKPVAMPLNSPLRLKKCSIVSNRLVDELFDVLDLVLLARFVDVQDLLFHLVQQLLDVPLEIIDPPDHPRAGLDQLPQQILLADDIQVIGQVGRAGHRILQLAQIGDAAHLLQQLPVFQMLLDGDQVNRQALVEHLRQRLVNRLMPQIVKSRLAVVL